MSLALEVAILLKAGTVWVNCHNLFDAAAGFGGYRHSGYGRDGGKEVERPFFKFTVKPYSIYPDKRFEIPGPRPCF